ncbi:MAG: threonine ammonia-lyase [Barnesiella sp.]|nr:threonine ammonia-lyase [Bacteroidales bacterium]MBD5246183.1 threonine ammonia-lyase [Barnesiella sp.]MBD5249178.1 threonine ammonia-lyase [Barnesiella sp.]MDE6081629.1 threonine ammonia-lyase [Muribaculaceae bacterium]
MLTIDEVYNAAKVLKDVARHPHLVPCKVREDAEIFLKPECLQHTGSFKLRGAYYKISQLTPEEKERGVIACSAGNHAQGVALGATHNGIKALICLPAGAPISKIEATKRYGAEVCLVPGVYDDAYAKAIELRDKHGYTFVHPFDDPKVIAGQGTIGLEIIEEMPDVDAIVVPIGGGGLISGIAFTVKTLRPDIKIYGVQAAGAPSMEESLKKNHIMHLDSVSTIADGIAVKEPGVNTFDICQKYVDEVVTVTDDEIATAILYLVEKQKLVSEGAGAVPLAAVMAGKIPVEGQKVVCMVSGGNIDVNMLNRVITRGLTVDGRLSTLTIDLADKPGQLSGVCNVIAEYGGNVISVTHERVGSHTQINGCTIRIELETRNHEHIAEIRKALSDRGYVVVK